MKRRSLLVAVAVVVLGLVIVTTVLLLHDTQPAARLASNAETPSGRQDGAKAALGRSRVTLPVAGTRHRQTIADAYAKRARFPDWSIPLSSKQWTLLHPNAYTPVILPVTLHGTTLNISVALPHATLFSDQPIRVTAHISAPARELGIIASVEASILTRQRKELAVFPLRLTAEHGNKRAYSGSEPAATDHDWPQELQVRVTAQVGSQAVSVLAPFRFQPVQAILTGVGDSYVDGAVLRIPLEFKVLHDGYYRVQANLFSQEGKRPIAHLTTEGRLDGTDDQLSLRCHASVLRSLDAPGPYQLTGFLITHLPDQPGQPTLLGRSATAAFPVAAHALSEYSNTPYHSSINQAREHFLQRLGGSGSGEN